MNKRLTSLALMVCIGAFCLSVASAAGGLTVAPSASRVFVNGQQIAFETYNIRGNNYFKLRDLAYTLSGTPKQFSVGWDSSMGMISLTSGMPYTKVGGEMLTGDGSSKTPVRTNAKISLDGKEASFIAYSIDGFTYFRLRDIGAAFNFSVEWDGRRNAIVINTSEDYRGPPPPLLAETEDMGQSYIDSIVFLGDSTTYGFQVYGVLTGGAQTKQVWTPESRTFSLFNQRNIRIYYPETGQNILIESAVAAKKPKYMVITLGINGVASMSEDSFISDYKALVNRILEANPDTKVMLNSIFPVARRYGSLGSINNAKIETANAWVHTAAEELGVKYLDSASVLKDSDGWLMPKYDAGDGLHLKPDAYRAVLYYIRTHGYS